MSNEIAMGITQIERETGSSDWSFEDFVENNKSFQNHIEDSLIFYPMVQELVIGIAKYYIVENTKVIDIGCSTNILIHKIKNTVSRNCSFIGMDTVELCDNTDPLFYVGDIRYDCDYSNSSFVTSCFTFDFLSKQDRMPLIKKIYDGLIDGGAFILVDKNIDENGYMQNMYDSIFLSKKHMNFNWEEIMQKHERLRGIQVPLSNSENIQMMKNAGFKNINMFFKYLNFTGIIGVK